jgi:hypothetical protein
MVVEEHKAPKETEETEHTPRPPTVRTSLDLDATKFRTPVEFDLPSPRTPKVTSFEDGSQEETPTPRRARLIDDIDEQLRSWRSSEDTAQSAGSTSTIAIPQISVQKHQKPGSDVGTNTGGRKLNEHEVAYLDFVLETLYGLIVSSALDKSGIQYRNTFAWRFHVTIPLPVLANDRLKLLTNLIGRLDSDSHRVGRDLRLKTSSMISTFAGH